MDTVGDGLLAWKGAAVGAWLALLFAAERVAPASPLSPTVVAGRWRRVGRNLAFFVISAGVSLGIVVPVSAWAAAHGLWSRPAWAAGGLGLALDLLLLDGLIYWWHRANHELPFLWRFHEVHHLDRFLDTTTALRFHFGEVILSALARAGVILVFAIPLSSVLVFETLVLAAAIFHHSNIRLPQGLERALALIVVTPSIHWVHHHRVRGDTDSNYSTILSLWDGLYGSRSATRRTAGMEIGVQGREERSLPGLLVEPWLARN
jgi:sterol desaturase/sphingolipid hydroxylase (fatty acid hydroxylase superfamily)